MEHVVLLDETGSACGTAAKTAVHHARTPLHLAFSAYLFNESGQFLLTRRAESKHTWPGVWTNTCCGHPLPGEPVADGVRRRLRQELGIGTVELVLVLPRFRYQARMDKKILVLTVGYANAVEMTPPEGVTVELTDPTTIIIRGVDKQKVGQFAAEVRQVRKPEPYKGKGIRYENEQVRRKEGKSFTSGG